MPQHHSAGDAALARRDATTQRSHRPRERRCAGGAPALVGGHLSRVQLRTVSPAQQLRAATSTAESAPDALRFEGHASVYERGYEMWDMFGPYTEVVSLGAGGASLSRGADVAFLVNHRGMTLARTSSGTLRLSEDETGLFSEADLDPENSAVRDLASAMRRGDMTEMSFAFRITRGQWSPDYSEYRIEEYDLDRGDVSAVNYGANPATTSQLRSTLGTDEVLAALAGMPPSDVARVLERAQQLRAPVQIPDARSAALRALVRPHR